MSILAERQETQRPSGIVIQDRLPWIVRLLGGKFREYPLKSEYRMRWGELSFGHMGLALSLAMFSEHFSLSVQIPGVRAWLTLPFLQRWHREPHEIMESWGFGTFGGDVHLHWGRHTAILHMPWNNWKHLTHDVRRPDGSWVPAVGCWEEKEPDGRQIETYPYRYVARNGQIQNVWAEVSVGRRRCRLKHLPIYRVRHSINVQFSDEVGEGRGSWKGGAVGCGYDLRPDETPRECLRRMERDRRFER